MSANRTTLDLQSHTNLGIQFIPAVTWVIMGIFGFVGNFFLVIAIVTNKNCRSNFYLCLMQLAVSDMIYSFFNIMIAMKRATLYLLDSTETCPPIDCLWMFIPQIISKDVSTAQAAVVGLDRLLGISMPVRYLGFHVKHLQIVNITLWIVLTTAFLSVMVWDLNPAPLIASCAMGQIWGTTLGFLSSGLGVAWEVVTIFLYSLLLAVLILHIVESKRKGNQTLNDLKKSGQYRSAITGFMILGVFTCVALTGDVFLSGTNNLDQSVKAKVQPYGNCFSLLATNLSFIICVWRNKDVKSQILLIISCGWLKQRQGKVHNSSNLVASQQHQPSTHVVLPQLVTNHV